MVSIITSRIKENPYEYHNVHHVIDFTILYKINNMKSKTFSQLSYNYILKKITGFYTNKWICETKMPQNLGMGYGGL